MSDETTNESNDKGKETTPDIPKPDELTDTSKKPISAVKEARAILEEIKKEKEELKEENIKREKIIANAMMGGTTGGRVESEVVSPEKKKVTQAQEFFKDTALGAAIQKTNE